MPATEADRHHLLDALAEAIGEEAAMTLAEHLPPAGWTDVATRHDLDALERRIDLRFAAIDERFAAIDQRFVAMDQAMADRLLSLRHEVLGALHQELAVGQRHLFFAVLGAMVANTGLVLAAARLFLVP